MTDNAPTVIDARGMGGITAIDGFDYQLWDLLIRIPAWLANPAFEQIVYEGIEDFEARFLAPQSPHGAVLDRYQAKASSLTPGDVRKVFETFAAFEKAFPYVARVQTLVMPSLPSTLNWMSRDSDRVRKARPFYAPFPEIQEAGDAALRKSFVDEYPGGLGEFAVASVEISERVLPDEATAVHAFAGELDSAYPDLNASHRQAKAAFDALKLVVRGSVGAPVGRIALRQTIEEALQRPLPIPAAFPMHVRSDRNERDETHLEIDASSFSGTEAGYPGSDQWSRELIAPLKTTSTWLRQQKVSRVALSGSYRLTTAMVIGWSLRSAIGFELEIPTREGAWSTDDRPAADTPLPVWQISRPTALFDGRLTVSVGVIRNPATDLAQIAGVSNDSILSLHLPEAIPSAKSAQAAAALIKRTVDEFAGSLKAERIDFYFAGPAALAVALGHRWNALPPTQLHEYLAGAKNYVPTAMIA